MHGGVLTRHPVPAAGTWKFADWKIVLVFSIPVLFVDEALKAVSRWKTKHHSQ